MNSERSSIFASQISKLSLRFFDNEVEQDYHNKINLLTFTRQYLIRRIVVGYAIIMILVIGYFDINLYLERNYTASLNLLVLIFVDIALFTSEIIFTHFRCTLMLRGILATLAPFISYQVFLKEVNPSGVDYPPGDFAAVAILTFNGMTLCYSWIIAALCYVFTLGFFLVFSTCVDTSRSSNKYPSFAA